MKVARNGRNSNLAQYMVIAKQAGQTPNQIAIDRGHNDVADLFNTKEVEYRLLLKFLWS